MKITNISNVEKFFEVVDQCKGKVELVTGEGDRLNLKSKLCQYVSLVSIFANNAVIPELEIIAHEPEDVSRLVKFMMGGE
ncbi:MAG: polya polymerase [Ruminococcus sp.]|nr:polya polymerase [Ruminococcus sp.]